MSGNNREKYQRKFYQVADYIQKDAKNRDDNLALEKHAAETVAQREKTKYAIKAKFDEAVGSYLSR